MFLFVKISHWKKKVNVTNNQWARKLIAKEVKGFLCPREAAGQGQNAGPDLLMGTPSLTALLSLPSGSLQQRPLSLLVFLPLSFIKSQFRSVSDIHHPWLHRLAILLCGVCVDSRDQTESLAQAASFICPLLCCAVLSPSVMSDSLWPHGL